MDEYRTNGASLRRIAGVWTLRVGDLERSYTGPTAILQAVFAAKLAQRGREIPKQSGSVAVSVIRKVA